MVDKSGAVAMGREESNGSEEGRGGGWGHGETRNGNAFLRTRFATFGLRTEERERERARELMGKR